MKRAVPRPSCLLHALAIPKPRSICAGPRHVAPVLTIGNGNRRLTIASHGSVICSPRFFAAFRGRSSPLFLHKGNVGRLRVFFATVSVADSDALRTNAGAERPVCSKKRLLMRSNETAHETTTACFELRSSSNIYGIRDHPGAEVQAKLE